MSADAAAVMRRFLDEVWNARRLDRFDEHVSRRVRFHPMRGEARDYGGYLQTASAFQGAFSDLHFAIEHVGAQDDRAFARIFIEGVNDGPYHGRAPTGRRVRVVGQPQCRVEEGKIVEFWQLFDELGMLQQLGYVEA